MQLQPTPVCYLSCSVLTGCSPANDTVRKHIHKFQGLGIDIFGKPFFFFVSHLLCFIILFSQQYHYVEILISILQRRKVWHRDDIDKSKLASKCQTKIWTDFIKFPRLCSYPPPFAAISLRIQQINPLAQRRISMATVGHCGGDVGVFIL